MTNDAHISYVLLDADGRQLSAWDASREYYAASTVKLAVAAAVMLAAETGSLSLDDTVPVRRRFASRVVGAPVFGLEPAEQDPGLPPDGGAVTLAWCLERMITVSSNEPTNMLVEALGQGTPEPGPAGLDAVNEACARLGVRDVRMTRLICDYAAGEAGFTHATTASGLAALAYAVVAGPILPLASRSHLLRLLRAQRFPIIAPGLPPGTLWGSKSGWDSGIRHDVAVIGDPGEPSFRVLAVCTSGFLAAGAQHAIARVAAAIIAPGALPSC